MDPTWRRRTIPISIGATATGCTMPLKLTVDRLGILAFPARKFVNSQVKLHLDYMEAELGRGPWFLGERFSAADIMLSFPLEAARVRGGLDATRPNLFGFVERIHARPAYRRALEKGGPYRFAQ
jgi:glutathione S-transferase